MKSSPFNAVRSMWGSSLTQGVAFTGLASLPFDIQTIQPNHSSSGTLIGPNCFFLQALL